MALFRWALLLAGIGLLAGIFAYSRGWLSFSWLRFRRRQSVEPAEVAEDPVDSGEADPSPQPQQVKQPALSNESKVVTFRIMPQQGESFPAERLVLILRGTGLQHGKYGIFHRMDTADPLRIRYSVASLIEPGSFDLTRLKESFYKGVSIFMVLPAVEDGVALFDEMLDTARTIARGINGRLVDESGSVLSVQRERYMRDEVIDFLRRHGSPADRVA